MYTSQFFKTKLGQASLASIGAMLCVIALTTQFQPSASVFAAQHDAAGVVELA
ncbi:MAG: hypothetical protein V2I27_01085 [Erythrobacter sp.]|jgi:hypothetical protein|nr:hypothetical protein [Erythrobacter sp.]